MVYIPGPSNPLYLLGLVKNMLTMQKNPSSSPGLEGLSREGIGDPLQCFWAALVAQLVKNLPAMRETWV